MATTDLDICATALLLVGADEINSFDDESREARICNQLYQTTIEMLLQTTEWGFSLAMVELARTTISSGTPEYEFGYTYEYTLPPDMLRIIKKDGLTNDYQIVGSKLYTNVSTVNILYQYRVSETKFPAYFTRLAELEMAKLLAGALLQDESQIKIWASLAKEQLIRAKTLDSQNNPQSEIAENNFALTSVR